MSWVLELCRVTPVKNLLRYLHYKAVRYLATVWSAAENT
jgi:hypothetical protein